MIGEKLLYGSFSSSMLVNFNHLVKDVPTLDFTDCLEFKLNHSPGSKLPSGINNYVENAAQNPLYAVESSNSYRKDRKLYLSRMYSASFRKTQSNIAHYQ